MNGWSALMVFAPGEERIARETSVIASLLLALFALLSSIYFVLSDAPAGPGQSWLTIACGITSLGGWLAATRYFSHLWLWYLIPAVLVVATAYFQPFLVIQILLVSVVLVRLTLPRRGGLIFAAVLLSLFFLAALASKQNVAIYIITIATTNAVLGLILIDTLLLHYSRDVQVRLLILFDKAYPLFVLILMVRVGLLLWEYGEQLPYQQYATWGAWLMLPILRKVFPKAFTRLLILMFLSSLLQVMWNIYIGKPVIGLPWPLLLVVLMLMLKGRWQLIITSVFTTAIIMTYTRLPIDQLYTAMWLLFGMFGLWILLGRVLFLLSAQPVGPPQHNLLGLNGQQWRRLAQHVVLYFVMIACFVLALLSPALVGLNDDQRRAQYQQILPQVDQLNEQRGQAVDNLVAAMMSTASSAKKAPGHLVERGQRLMAAFPILQRWRYVDARQQVVLDIEPYEVTGTRHDDASTLLRQVGYAMRMPGQQVFISRPLLRTDTLVSGAEAFWQYIVVPIYTPTGTFDGALVANVDFADMLLGVLALAGDNTSQMLLDRNGHYLYQSARGFVWDDFLHSDSGLGVDEYLTYATIRSVGTGYLTVDNEPLAVFSLQLGPKNLPESKRYDMAGEGVLLIDWRDSGPLGDLLRQSWFWMLAMSVVALMLAMAIWLARNTLLKQALDEKIAVQQALQLEAEAEADKAMQAEKNKSLFLSNMSHEMRTPLNGLIGIGQILQRGVDSAQRTQLLAMLQDSAERMKALVNDILDTRAIEKGELSVTTAPFNLVDCFNSIVFKQQVIAQHKGLDVETDMAAMPFPNRRGDQQRIGQIIDNLLSNAIKFTDSGRVSVSLGGDAQQVCIVVQDTGIGMTPEVQQRIFERFEQGDLTTTKRYQGAGLGLSICRELINRMQGSIEVFSVPGEGSRFEVRLPLPIVVGDDTLYEQDANFALVGRVLVVDDEPTNLLVLSEVLKAWGVDVVQANNGHEALQAVHDEPLDIVLTDIAMPRMTGVELLHALRSEGIVLPVYALTGNANNEEMINLQQEGFIGVFSKPLDFDALRVALQKHLETLPAVPHGASAD